MQNLGLVNDDQRERLQYDIDRGLDMRAAQALRLDAVGCGSEQADWGFKHRFVGFALEAYRRKIISQAKLHGLAAMVSMPVKVLLSLLQEDEDGNIGTGDVSYHCWKPFENSQGCLNRSLNSNTASETSW